jgi:hypothetical protein
MRSDRYGWVIVPEVQVESKGKPHAVADDYRWKSAAFVKRGTAARRLHP